MGKIIHIVYWKLRQSANVAAGEDAYASAKKVISQLKSVPGAESMHLGPPISMSRTQGFDYGLYSVFSSKEALDEYAVSESHVKVAADIKQHITDGMAYDFELGE